MKNAKFGQFFVLIKNFQSLLIILLTIFLSLIAEPYLSIDVKSFFVAISNCIRAILLCVLPLVIFPYIVRIFSQLKTKGVLLIILIFILISVSNFTAIIIGYLGHLMFIPDFSSADILKSKADIQLIPLFELTLPQLFSIEKTIICGFILGFFLNFIHNDYIENIFDKYYKVADFFFQKIMSPVIPLYILGVIMKINHETELKSGLSLFGNMFAIIIIVQMFYLFLLFLIGSNWNLSLALKRIKNSLPASLTAFLTMSRVMSLPVILTSAEKNADNPAIARITAPAIMNAHAVGECISLPIIILTVLSINHLPSPNFSEYLEFAYIMTIAQFSAVSIPGGSLIILMPFLNAYFGFNPDMIALMFAFDIFFDSVGTAMNTFGDLAFISLVEKIWKKFPKFHKIIVNSVQDARNSS